MERLLVSLAIVTMDTEAALNPREPPPCYNLPSGCGNLRQHHYPGHQGAGISSSCCSALKGSGLADVRLARVFGVLNVAAGLVN